MASMTMNRSQVRRVSLLELEQVHHRQDGQEWVPHWHAEWSFGAVVQGECRCHVAGRPFRPRAGDIMAIAPLTVHTGVLSALPGGGVVDPCEGPSVSVTMLYVPPDWLAREGLAPPARSGLLHSPGLARRARNLESPDEVQAWLRQAVPALGAALAAGTSASMPPPSGGPSSPDVADPRPSEAVRQLLDDIRAAVLQGGELSVSGIAHRCGVSRERIHQVVKRWIGLPPSDYLRTVRLHRARDLLLSGQPLATVAADCGFADQAHFTRWFRRAFGYTPGDWVGATAA